MPKVDKKPRVSTTTSETGHCRKCQETKLLSKFYDSTNPNIDTNGKMSVCKDCCNEIYQSYFNEHKNIESAIKLTCRDLDIKFSKDALEHTKSHIESFEDKKTYVNSVFGVYKSKLMSTEKTNSGNTNFRYKDSDFDGSDNEAMSLYNYIPEEYESIEIEFLRNKWGSEIPPNDLSWLEEKYNEWDTAYDISGKSRELIVEQICFEELFIHRGRQRGDDVSKRIATVRALMADGNFSPKQESASETAEFQTLSEFIKRVEQTKPIISDKYTDIDGMEKMWKSMAGAINRTQGKPDEYTKIFEEEYKDYTLDLNNVDSGGDK